MYQDFLKNQRFLDFVNRCIEIRNTDNFQACFSNFLSKIEEHSCDNYISPKVDPCFSNYLCEINKDLNSFIFNDELVINANNHFNIDKISFKEFMEESCQLDNEYRELDVFLNNILVNDSYDFSFINFVPFVFSLADKFDDVDFKFVFDVLCHYEMYNETSYGLKFFLKSNALIYSCFSSNCYGCGDQLYPFYDFEKNELIIINSKKPHTNNHLDFNKKCDVFEGTKGQKFNRKITINVPSKRLIISNNFFPLLPEINGFNIYSFYSIKEIDKYQKDLSDSNILCFLSSDSNSLYRNNNDYVIASTYCSTDKIIDEDDEPDDSYIDLYGYVREYNFDSEISAVMAMDYEHFLSAIKRKYENQLEDDEDFKTESELASSFYSKSTIIDLVSDTVTFNLFNINDEEITYMSFSDGCSD